MITLVIAASDRETGGYLERKCKQEAMIAISAICRNMEELTLLIKRYAPDAILLDISPDPKRVLSLAQELVESFPSTAIFLSCRLEMCNQEIILSAMRVGARAFLPMPFDDDLQQAVLRLSQTQSHKNGAQKPRRGHLVSVIGSKGGVGTTIISASLAVALAQKCHKSVALVDLNLQLGDVCLLMNLEPKATITDIAGQSERMDVPLLKEMMTRHTSGVSVLAAPRRLEEGSQLAASDIQKAYPSLLSAFDWVVVDLSGRFDELLFATLQYTDEILLVTQLNVVALRNAKRYIEIMERSGVPHDKVRLVVNRYHKRAEGAVNVKEAESALGHAIDYTLPDDEPTVTLAINRGFTLKQLAPKSAIVLAFDNMALQLNRSRGAEKSDVNVARQEMAPAGFFARLFRTDKEVETPTAR